MRVPLSYSVQVHDEVVSTVGGHEWHEVEDTDAAQGTFYCLRCDHFTGWLAVSELCYYEGACNASLLGRKNMAKPKCDKCGVDLARLEVGVCLECVDAAFPDGVNGPKVTPAGKLPASRELVDFLGGVWAVSHEVRAGSVWGFGVVLVAQRAGAKVQCFIEAAAWPAWFKWDGKAKRWIEREERRKVVSA